MKKIFIIFALFFTTACAQAFQTFTLDNGQTVIIKEMHNNPIVTIDTWVKTGSVNETEKNTGVAHFLEHLFFKGTQKYPTGEFEKILESKGAQTNAGTSKDFTHYYITIPSKDFETALFLHADMLLNPLIPRKELEKERKVVIEEISRDLDEPQSALVNNLMQILYPTHPYHRKVLGTKEVISTISREEIMDFYKKYYTPSNMITVIAGDINPQFALSKVQEAFNAPKSKTKTTPKKLDPIPKKQIEKKMFQDVASGYTILAMRTVPACKQKDTYALDVLAVILGSGKSSRLNQVLKEQKQLATSISAGHSSQRDDGLFYVSAEYTPNNYEKLKSEIFSQIQALKDEEITDSEINKAKEIIQRQTQYSRESTSSIATQLGILTILTGSPAEYDTYLSEIQKVTREDLKRVAKKYLNLENSAISTILPTEKKISNLTPKKESYTTKLISRSANVSKYELEGGATLIINKNNANDILAISINAKGGNYLEPVPSTASILASVLLQGSEKYSREELACIMEENGIVISPSATADTFDISVKTTKDKLPLALELLDEVINRAKLTPYEIEKAKNLKIASLEKIQDNPLSIAIDNFKGQIYKDRVYAHNSEIYKKTIPFVGEKQVKDYYKKIFCAPNVVISINGDVDHSQVSQKLAQIFNNTSCKKIEISDLKQFIPLTLENVENKISKKTNTLWIVAGYQTDGLLNQKECATLSVINSILGRGMSSRLFTDLRENQGLAYQVGSSFSPNVNEGSFIAYIGTNPQNYETAKSGILNEFRRLQTEFVGEKELQDAKDKLLGNYVLSLETNMEKASALGWYEASGRGFEYHEKYPQLIESVTASDVLTVANKYFSQPYFMSVVGP